MVKGAEVTAPPSKECGHNCKLDFYVAHLRRSQLNRPQGGMVFDGYTTKNDIEIRRCFANRKSLTRKKEGNPVRLCCYRLFRIIIISQT